MPVFARVIAVINICAACLPCQVVRADDEVFRTNRVFEPVEINAGASLYSIMSYTGMLTGIIGPFPLETNSAYSVEYEGVSWGQDSFSAAWSNVLACNYPSNRAVYSGIFDDPGWIKGTRGVEDSHAAYMWILQDRLTFTTSGKSTYTVTNEVTTNSMLFWIEKVMVGTLGDFEACETVEMIFPEMDDPGTNYPGYTRMTSAMPPADGSQTVKYRFDTSKYYRLVEAHVALIPDFNHDRVINNSDRVDLGEHGVYRFWINDDDDEGYEEGDDIPGAPGLTAEPDWQKKMVGWNPIQQYVVDGVRDLVDFFPVHIDAGPVLDAWPPEEYKYILKHETGELNALLEPGLAPDDAGSYLTDSEWAEAHGEAELTVITGSGVELGESFLEGIRTGNKGVILCEGRGTTDKPLVIEVVRKSDNRLMSTTELPLSLSGVEQMYRRISLRSGGESATSTNEPSNNPDSLGNGRNVFFLHGFNVDSDAARGWSAEIYKRLYWSGSRAGFWGMTWDGDEGLVNAMNYQENVANAFETAALFAERVGGVSGEKIVLAHSLGNMVVSAAIQDHGLAVDKYFMLNAAVALECYDTAAFNDSVNNNQMLHSEWIWYTNRAWCSKWFELFDQSSDCRAQLAWRDRFPSVLSVAYNFYSTGDEIFEIYTNGMPSPFSGGLFHLERYAWHKQEIFKGTGTIGGTSWAGWGFNSYYDWETDEYHPIYSADAASEANEQTLCDNPVFSKTPEEMFSPVITTQKINEIIAKGIPALSSAVGRNEIEGLAFSYDVNVHKPNGWGRDDNTYHNQWLHSDLRDMAYLYTYDLFDEISIEGAIQ